MSAPETKVLYLSYDGMTDPLPQSQVLPYLQALSKCGLSFTIISFEKAEVYESNKEHIEALCLASSIHWIPLLYTKKPPVLSTIYDIYRLRNLCVKLIQEQSFEVLHCRSYITAMIGLWMKQKYGTKFIFDMRGFWADERVDGHIWSLGNPLYRRIYNFFKAKEKAYFLNADYTVSLTYAGKNEIMKFDYMQGIASNIDVIPCCVDTDFFSSKTILPLSQINLKQKLGIPQDAYVLGYIGSIGTWYMLPEMLDFFVALKEQDPSAVFLFLTREPPENIIRLAEEKKIDTSSLRILGVSRAEMPLHISLLNASVFFIRPTFSKKASSPTKQGEIMSMSIPIVCNAGVGDGDFVIAKYDAGVVLSEFTKESYNIASKELKQKSFNVAKIRQGAEEFYSLNSGVNHYYTIYQKILG